MDLNKWKAQIRKGTLEMVLMSVIRDGEKYGFEIINLLKESHDLVIAEGTLYPLFSRLKSEGLIISKWVYTNTGHPRKYYSLTRKGRAILEEMRAEWDRYVTGIDRILLSDKAKAGKGSKQKFA